jgi:hypothetical protein
MAYVGTDTAEDGDDQAGNKARTDKDILAEATKRYQMCLDANNENINDARADLQFLKGGRYQWDEVAVTARESAGLPMITVNTLPAFLHQVTNDQRMNTPMIKVHPVDDQADKESAQVIQGLIRHIEYDSNADVALDTAVNCAAAVGFGYFQLITDYEAEDSFDQCIKYKRIRNPLSVKIDPLSVEADGSDMRFAFIESLMSKEDFKREYPDADASENAVFSGSDSTVTAWITSDTVMVCEYYCIESEPDELVELSNGEKGFKSKLLELPPGVTIVRKRDTTRSKVMWRKISACDILEETEIKCQWIPVFPVYGDEIDIDGKVTRSGIIRNAKGPAQSYNVFMTGATEEVMLRSKSPYMMAEGQEEGHEQEFQMANRAPLAFITYKPTTLEGQLLPPPQRTPTADIPTGMMSMAMQSKENIMATTGLFQASIGARGTATSGKQELAQQREGDMANYHYMDGLLRTLRHAGRCLVNMIPHYYNKQRTVRILGEDDSAEHVTINQPTMEQKQVNGQIVAIEKVLNDLSVGKYDVTISNGPSFSTMRQESADFFTSAMQAAKDPATMAAISYLAIKNQDVPHSDLAAKLIKATMPPVMQQIIDDETGGDEKDGEDQEPVAQTPEGPLPLSQVPQAIDALKQQIMQAQEALQSQEAEAKTVQADKTSTQLQKAALDAQQKVMNAEFSAQQQVMQAEFDRMTADIARMKAELNAEVVKQEAQDDQVITQVVAKFKDLESGIKQMMAGMQQGEQPGGDVFSAMEQVLAEAQATAQGAVSTILQGRPPKEFTIAPQNDEAQQQMLAAMAQMLAEVQATTQATIAAVAAITEPKKPKRISITAPSGQTYNGVVS